jgi:hypothetical protein
MKYFTKVLVIGDSKFIIKEMRRGVGDVTHPNAWVTTRFYFIP